MHGYDEICLSVVKNLTSRSLNTPLSLLVENDNEMLAPNDYVPSIWECKWFNDSTIAGYLKGDVVWKWTATEDQFLCSYMQLVQKYAAENPRLNGYLTLSISPFDNEIERQKYENVISGYSENGGKPLFGPMFDFCMDYSNGSAEYKPSMHVGQYEPQLFISLVDDNKSLLSDEACWVNAVIKDSKQLSAYIESQLDNMMYKHVQDYHFGGLSSEEEFDDVLLAKDFSNFDIKKVYNQLKMHNHSAYMNQQGMDYVVSFAKQSLPSHLSGENDNRALHRWCRVWNSGYVEHGGIVEVLAARDLPSCNSLSDYEVSVELDWAKGCVSAQTYDYPSTTSSMYGSQFDDLYYAKLSSDAIEFPYDASSGYIKPTNRYQVSLTPVMMVSNDISAGIKFKPYCDISAMAYPSQPNDDRNSTYVNFEVHKVNNHSFCISRSNTLCMDEMPLPRYVQYYTCGYNSNPAKTWNIAYSEVKNLRTYYPYTGNPVDLSNMEVYSNVGELLVRDVDYTVEFNVLSAPSEAINAPSAIGHYGFTLYALHPYTGTMSRTDVKGTSLSFTIANKVSNSDGYEISGVSSVQIYGESI